MEQRSFEGTWEEILLQSPQLVGRRVRLTVLTDEASQLSSSQTLDQLLEGRVGRVSFQPANLSERTGEAFADLLEEKCSSLCLD